MTLNIRRTRDLLQALDYQELFLELGWSQPKGKTAHPTTQTYQQLTYSYRVLAELSGVTVIEIVTPGGIPNSTARREIYKAVSSLAFENLLIFVDAPDTIRTQSMWYWMKRESGDKAEPREHLYVKGQPGDLSLGKLERMVFDISDFDSNGRVPVYEVARRLQQALDVERVTKQFYEEFRQEHLHFLDLIDGITDERDKRWYASVLLNRLMFIYFLQRKWFLDNGNAHYLQQKLAESRERGDSSYYADVLKPLFFEGFAKPEEERSPLARQRLGNIRYLNGGLFLKHPIEQRWPNIAIPDEAFEHLLALFARYSWNLDDTPGGNDNEISPHVLGYIFEKYINQKFFGAYYTRPEITEYLCERTIHKLILEKINTPAIPGVTSGRSYETVEELLLNLNAPLCRKLLEILPTISILDPACGSGAFLVSAMNTLTKIYGAVTGKIDYLSDINLTKWLSDARKQHQSLSYYIKKKIITENLFGVDIMEEATEIAKLRLFLALVSSAYSVEQLEPLPNIDFNILPGNSLIGLLQVNEAAYDSHIKQLNLFVQKTYKQMVDEKNINIQAYKSAAGYSEDLRTLRDNIQAQREEAISNLNELLLDEFNRFGVKYEQATWDASKQADGKAKKRALTLPDIHKLHPFHWGYEFDRVMNERGGFDIIITNPPWEILKPQAKEFFAEHSELVSKNKMRIEEFEQEQSKLLQNPLVRDKWLDYQSGFPHQSAYFRTAPQYSNQISMVNGKKAGTDINLYKLFTEQCYNLLRCGGQCGIVIPSGIYTDLGAKQLRELLFAHTHITGLFGFENRKTIFEGVDSRFKFVVLTFEKGGETHSFPSAFMRHDVAELQRFPRYGALHTSVELIRRLSPDSLSIMEFKSDLDVQIARKMLAYPLLGEKREGTWNLILSNEFHMTNDAKLFKTQPAAGRLPLYEGKMIHQFTHKLAQSRYWVDEQQGRKAILGRNADTNQQLNYQWYRLGHRSIASSTNERTMIATILPPMSFFGHSINASNNKLSAYELLFIVSVLNSFVVDFSLRQRVTANLTMFYIYQLPVPRLTEQDAVFKMIVERAARLICTTVEFQLLWEQVMPNVAWTPDIAATSPTARGQLRAEIDGLVAHLYNLNEDEFKHVLSTFPQVEQAARDAALEAYSTFAMAPDDLPLWELLRKGETERVEFKVAACWNAKQARKDDSMRDNIVKEVAAFLNSRDGGTLLIGVDDEGNVIGLSEDYCAANPQKANRDGYQLFLSDILKSNLSGGNWSLFHTISFGSVQGKDICRIDIQPADDAVYVKGGHFYVREGNRARLYSTQEAMAYMRARWPS